MRRFAPRQKTAGSVIDDIDAELERLSRDMAHATGSPGGQADDAVEDDEVEALVRETMSGGSGDNTQCVSGNMDAELEALMRRSTELMAAKGPPVKTRAAVAPALDMDNLDALRSEFNMHDLGTALSDGGEAGDLGGDLDISTLDTLRQTVPLNNTVGHVSEGENDTTDLVDTTSNDHAPAKESHNGSHLSAIDVVGDGHCPDGPEEAIVQLETTEIKPMNDVGDIVRTPARLPAAAFSPARSTVSSDNAVVAKGTKSEVVSAPDGVSAGPFPAATDANIVQMVEPQSNPDTTSPAVQSTTSSTSPPMVSDKMASPNGAPGRVVAADSGLQTVLVEGCEVLSVAKMLRALLSQAQTCQGIAKALHSLGDSPGAVSFVRRQRAFEADIAALRPQSARPDAASILQSQTAVDVRIPRVSVISAAANEAVAEGVLRLTVRTALPSPDLFVRVTCESQALDGSVPAQQDVLSGSVQWPGFVADGIRATKFVEHRRVRLDLRRRGPPPPPPKKPGIFDSLLRFVSSDEPEVKAAEPDAMNLDAVTDGSVLVATGSVKLAPLLSLNSVEADVELLAPRVDGQPKSVPPISKLSVLLETRRPMQSKSLLAQLRAPENEEVQRWHVLVSGQSGPAVGLRVESPQAPSVFLPLDTEDGVVCASYVVLEEEIALLTPSNSPRLPVLRARLETLISAVDGGSLTLEAYTAHVRTALVAAKRLAVERKRTGDVEAASAWLRRVRLMEGELREVGVTV